MIRGVLSVATVATLCAATPAGATCTQPNAVGTWKLYSASANNSGVNWVKCTLAVQSNGTISGASTCSNDLGQSTPVTGRVVLTNAANCTFGGSVRYTLDGAISTVTDATMAESKETVEGVGIFAGGAFIFNMVKIK